MSAGVVQVVPRLEPFGGVASHARTLARVLEQEAALSSRLLPAERNGDGDPAARLLAALGETDGAPVLVHYSNYGYDRRGCPRWLLAALERWRALRPRGRLVTVFHEVYATGHPWQSSFWLSPLQRRLAAQLRRLSDGAITSVQLYGDILRAWHDGGVVTLPVFSTVGEPTAPRPLSERRRRLVVFGSPGLRARAYARASGALRSACAALEVEEIADIGPQTVAPASVQAIPVQRLGEQPDETVSALLADSVAGFVCYPEALVGKSTVFAAYAAHRLVPVCATEVAGSANGDGAAASSGHLRRLWNPSAPASAGWQEIADGAHHWYQGHSLARHAAVYAELLR